MRISRNTLYIREEMRAASATPSLYGRWLAPEATGPGQFMRRSRGLEALEASVGPRLTLVCSNISARLVSSI